MSYRSLIRTRPLLVGLAMWLFLMWIWVTNGDGQILSGAAQSLAVAAVFAFIWEATGWASTRLYRALFA